jgi:antitoxin (DNA-binding transcriptional repressor) of toxin-antitoxin stability system
MREVGAFEAKNRFGQRRDRVKAGKSVAITGRGKIVAHLAPPAGAFGGGSGRRRTHPLTPPRRDAWWIEDR